MVSDTTKRHEDFRRWGAAALVLVGLGFGVAVWYGLKVVAESFALGRIETHDRTGDWARFYRDEFSGYFWIPPEAQVVSASQSEGFMYELVTVKFRLPPQNPPENWAALIAQNSGIGRFRQNALRYDASHRPDTKPNRYKDSLSDVYFLRYDPTTKLYEASWGWD